MIQPRIINIEEKKLVGQSLTMSLTDNKTGQLWGKFMPRHREISNSLNQDLFSLQVYAPGHFEHFNPNREFKKWALVEVKNFEELPDGMEPFTLSEGLYAVFDYKGSSTDSSIFQYIYSQWLPDSEYALDDRPHFEILGAKYKNADPNSEEEIWIPIKLKKAG